MDGRCATSLVCKPAPIAEPGATVQPVICGACCTAFGDDPLLRAPIDWAVRALMGTPLVANSGYCHGMAGQLEVWIMLAQYQRLADLAGRRAALAAQLLEHLGFRANNLWAWPAEEPDQIRLALWTGTLGPACALALFHSGGRDTLFSRQTLTRVFAPQS